MDNIKDVHPEIWDEAVDSYCADKDLDVSDIYIVEHEDKIKEIAIEIWSNEHPCCEHSYNDACYYCKMD